MVNNRILIILGLSIVLLTGCDRHPLKKTSTLADEGLLPGVSSTFIIYDDHIKTGGNLFSFPGGENQVVDLAWREQPYNGAKCIKYSWNGKDVNDANAGIVRHDFAGLDLVVSQGADDFIAAGPVDLSAGGYAKLSFFIRGSLSADTSVKIEAVDDGDSSTDPAVLVISSLSNTWQRKEITVPAGDLAAIKEYIKITFIYVQPTGSTTPGTGGTVYLDDIKLEQ